MQTRGGISRKFRAENTPSRAVRSGAGHAIIIIITRVIAGGFPAEITLRKWDGSAALRPDVSARSSGISADVAAINCNRMNHHPRRYFVKLGGQSGAPFRSCMTRHTHRRPAPEIIIIITSFVIIIIIKPPRNFIIIIIMCHYNACQNDTQRL